MNIHQSQVAMELMRMPLLCYCKTYLNFCSEGNPLPTWQSYIKSMEEENKDAKGTFCRWNRIPLTNQTKSPLVANLQDWIHHQRFVFRRLFTDVLIPSFVLPTRSLSLLTNLKRRKSVRELKSSAEMRWKRWDSRAVSLSETYLTRWWQGSAKSLNLRSSIPLMASLLLPTLRYLLSCVYLSSNSCRWWKTLMLRSLKRIVSNASLYSIYRCSGSLLID